MRDYDGEDDVIGGITAVFDKFLQTVSKKMGSIDQVVNIINMENWKIAFFGAGKYAMLTIITEAATDDQKLKVYGSFVAKKVASNIAEIKVDQQIPQFLRVSAASEALSSSPGKFHMKIILAGNSSCWKTDTAGKFYRYIRTYN